VKLHLDTDLGGDPDDACALVMLLGWPDVELLAVTTNLDPGGRRAGCTAHYLALAGRADVAVVAGAEATLTAGDQHHSTWGDARSWPDPVQPLPARPGAALDRLAESIGAGATTVTVGALTNLAELELSRPGALYGVPVVVMGGWLDPPADGYPTWGPERDWNLQCDTRAAEVVLESGADLTFVTIPATIGVHLRAAHLPRLRASGPVGRLLAQQSEVYAASRDMAALGRAHPLLADDLVNFHWDPVTCAVAVGWPGIEMSRVRVTGEVIDGVLLLRETADGRPARFVTTVDAEAFHEAWLTSIETAARAGARG